MSTLSLNEKIGQLMMVAAYSNRNGKPVAEIDKLVTQHNIGGLIFFQGGPVRQARLTNRYQGMARTPLLIGMDLEWGLAMRLDSTQRFPKQMTLGAMQDDGLIEAMGLEIARQMTRLGVQVSFSPVADVNNNPANPVINDRSFGEDRELVARKAIAYMRGLQNGGVIATAKHFPGHGDTDLDSHLTLPVIAHTRARLDSLELYPFQRMMAEGLSAVMVAHLEVPALDTTRGLPSTLSHPVVSDLLERELGFKGLVFTDALNMKGVANGYKAGEIELRALLAGNDVLLFPQDPVKAIERIRQAVDSGSVPLEMIDHKCLKVLRAKEWAGLARSRPVTVDGLVTDLNSPGATALRRDLYTSAITTLRNTNDLLPLRDPARMKIASLVIGDSVNNDFQEALGRYGRMDRLRCDKDIRRDSAAVLLRRLEKYDLVIASIHGTTCRVEKEFGVPDAVLDLLRVLSYKQSTIMVHFGNPYRLTRAYGAQDLEGLIVTYEENFDTEDLAAQVIFGAIGTTGRLPVTASSYFAAGDGIALKPIQRLAYGIPEEAGLRTSDMEGIDAMVKAGIAAKAFPGCQVLVAVDGRVIWNKAYGHSTYEARQRVKVSDLYDLASVTKVAATTLALMKLADTGALDLDRTVGHYLPELEAAHPTHAAMALRDVLTHQAGLQPFVPFYMKLLKDGKFKSGVVSDSATETHSIRLAERLYMLTAYRDSLWEWMLSAPVAPRGDYLYSDMGYYLLMAIVERLTGTTLDAYVNEQFYAPLGLASLGYRPLDRFPRARIIPTEYDVDFRRAQVWGEVHDPGAAMLGGVAGHAGLFSNANDLGIIMQMLLNSGTYGGRRYLSEEVIKEFTRCQFCKPGTGQVTPGDNRRGLGWDKPQPHGTAGPACECVSYASFGHTGFTGTMVWADPETRSTYVFLSNRIHPNANNRKLAEMNIRTRIQEVVNDAISGRLVAVQSVGARH